MSVVTSEEVFACYRRSCAPPPVGKGGSNKGGIRGGDAARKSGIAKAKESSYYHNPKKKYGPDQERSEAATHQKVVNAGKVAKFKAGGKMKSVKSDPMVSKTTAYDKYVELRDKNKAKKAAKSG